MDELLENPGIGVGDLALTTYLESLALHEAAMVRDAGDAPSGIVLAGSCRLLS